MKEWLLALCIGFLMDLILGDPHGIYHPVQGIGWLITKTENIVRKIFPKTKQGECLAGGVLTAVVICLSCAVPLFLLWMSGSCNFYLKFALECLICYQLLAVKSLKDESGRVYQKLAVKDIEGARRAASMIVGRDTASLLEEGLAKAAVETVAENTSDGVIAPMLFMALFGPVGGFFYKAVNTMDSMIGYKNERYLNFGKIAARFDDVLNYIPARISAWLMIWAAFCLRLDFKNAYRIYKRDRRNHASPNSAQTEAVCAGALRIQLAGDAYYFGKLVPKQTIGDNLQKITLQDIKMAAKLLYVTSFTAIIIIAMIGVIL